VGCESTELAGVLSCTVGAGVERLGVGEIVGVSTGVFDWSRNRNDIDDGSEVGVVEVGVAGTETGSGEEPRMKM